MSDFWNSILSEFKADIEASTEYNDFHALILDLCKDDTRMENQKKFIAYLLKQENIIQELEDLSEEEQKLILIKIIQYNPSLIDDPRFFSFAHKTITTEELLELKKEDTKFERTTQFINEFLEKNQTSRFWCAYYNSRKIDFNSSGDDADFFEDLKKPENEAALKHIAIFLIQKDVKDEILMKKALKFAYKDYFQNVISIMTTKNDLQQFSPLDLLEKTTSIQEWYEYFKLKNIELKYEENQKDLDLIEVLNQSKNTDALKYLLPYLLKFSKNDPSILGKLSENVLKENIKDIPIDSIILLNSHENFQKHPLYDVILPVPDWSFLLGEHLNILKEFNAQALIKLFQLSKNNPLIEAIEFRTIDTLQFLKAIKKTGNKELLLDILTQRSYDSGKDALNLALGRVYGYGDTAAHDVVANVVVPILDAIIDIEDEELISRSFTQNLADGPNALMSVAQYRPENFTTFLKIINSKGLVNILKQSGWKGYNALMFAACRAPDAVVPILEAIMKTNDEKLLLEILSQHTSDGYNALMFAACRASDAVVPILEAIMQTGNNKLLLDILTQKKENGDNALMLAIRYNPDAVAPILNAISKIESKNKLFEIFSTYDARTSNALEKAFSSHNCVKKILTAIESLDGNHIDIIFSNQIVKANLNNSQYRESLKGCLGKIYKYQITNNKKTLYDFYVKYPKDQIKINNDAHFNIIQGIYHLHGWLQENEKSIKPVNFQNINEFIKKLIATDVEPNELREILKTLRELVSQIPKLKQHQIIKDLEKAITAYQIESITWPESEAYNLINDKKSIDSILETITPETLVDETNLSIFKPIFKAFPEDWKKKYLHQCHILLDDSYYDKIYIELQSFVSEETFMPNVQVKVPSAPLEIEAIPCNQEFSPLANAVVISDAETYQETLPLTNAVLIGDGQKETDASVEVTDAQLWRNLRNEGEFILQLQSLDDNKTIFNLISDMRKPSIFKLFDQNKNQIIKWIEKNPQIRKKIHLFELVFFAHHYANLAETMESSCKKTELINLSKDLIKLKIGLDWIYKEIEEISLSNATQQEKYKKNLKIYEVHRKWITEFVYRFENFNTAYPNMMNFTSVLRHPNGAFAHTLVELAPYKPILPTPYKEMEKSSQHQNHQFLISSVKEDKKQFIQKVNKYATTPQLFKEIDTKSHKNLLLLALETKDIDKINAVAKVIYQFNPVDRRTILESCNNKGYRLTSYIREKDSYLCLLELERLALKLERLNPLDPNAQVLKNLSLALQNEPTQYLTYIEEARRELKKNSSWRQWFGGKYSQTDYGIGIFKETIEGLLDKVENAERSILKKQKLGVTH